MKVKNLHICLTVFLVSGSFCTLLAQAQHEGLSPKEFLDPSHQELNLNDDKVLLFDQESKTKSPKDSILVIHTSKSPFVTSSKGKHGEPIKPFTGKNEDDALSFNFLYYIIQKFKISDLIDQ